MISFSHPTPVCFDEKGSSEGHGFPDFSDWCYHRYANTIHEMTEAQRRAEHTISNIWVKLALLYLKLSRNPKTAASKIVNSGIRKSVHMASDALSV
jgi:hypothetical protein